MQAAQAAQSAVPVGLLADRLAAGQFMQSEALLDAAFAEMDALLLGDEGDADALRAAAGKRGLQQVIEEAMSDGADAAPVPGMAFDRANPEAVRWARERAARLVVDVTEQSRAAVRRIIARAVEGKLTPREAARLIRNVVGLTELQSDAVLNMQVKLLAQGKLDEAVRKAGERYAARLLRYRAETIARTETIAAANEGQRQLWKQAQERGFLKATQRRRWITTPDERLCPVCKALNGKTATLGEPFPGGYMNPPAHPNCRCATGLSFARDN